MGLAEQGLIDRLGHCKQALKGHRCRAVGGGWIANRQLLKNAAAAVVDQHHGELAAQLLAPEPAVAVVEQGQVAAEQHRPAQRLGHATGEREGAVDARSAAKAQHRPGSGAWVGKALPVTHRRTVGDHQRQTLGQ